MLLDLREMLKEMIYLMVRVDVVVCDGFIGNITLKASEGVASTIFTLMKTQIRKSIPAKIGALLMKKKVFEKAQR